MKELAIVLTILVVLVGVVITIMLLKKEKFIIPPNIGGILFDTLPLQSGVYSQMEPEKKGLKVEIVNGPGYNYANVFDLSHCDDLRYFYNNKHLYALSFKVLYAGSAEIDGKIVHTYASYETRDYNPIYGMFDCQGVATADYNNERKFYDRQVYTTLKITELPNNKILINYRRQKLKNEYTLYESRNFAPTKHVNPPGGNTTFSDSRNFFDTDIDLELNEIILKKESGKTDIGGGTSGGKVPIGGGK